MHRFTIVSALLGCGCALTESAGDGAPDAGAPAETFSVCVDACSTDLDCEILGSPALCVEGRCREPPIGESPACVDDDDCGFLLATYFATPCETRDECFGPGYSGPCVDGHSSGVALCGLPYFGICETALLATNHETGEEVELCGTVQGPIHCIDGSCERRPLACETDGGCAGYGVCVNGTCSCDSADDCTGPAARVGTAVICESEREEGVEYGEGRRDLYAEMLAFCEVLVECVPDGAPSVEDCAFAYMNNILDIREFDERCEPLADAMEEYFVCVSELPSCGPLSPSQRCSAESDEIETQRAEVGDTCPSELGSP